MPGAYPQGRPADDDWETMTSVTVDRDDAASVISMYAHHMPRPPVVPYSTPGMAYHAPAPSGNAVYQMFQEAWANGSQTGAVV